MRRKRNEDGYILLVILIAMTIAAIAAAAAVPYIKTQIQREREIELMHEGNEYVKAIQKYYHKFGRYPATLDQLEKTNNIRFLRRRYKDPLTGKDDWRIIHMGEAKYPPKLKIPGASGQPIGQQIGQNIGTPIGGGFMGGNSAISNNSSGGGAVNPQQPNQNGTQDGGPQPVGGVGFSLGGNSSGSSFGGMPIIGVAVPSTAKSLKIYNDRQHYNEWEFIYDPRIEALQHAAAGGGAAGNGGIGLPSTNSAPTPTTAPSGTMGGSGPVGGSIGPQ